MENKYVRDCPGGCGGKIIYSNAATRRQAVKSGTWCKSCRQREKNLERSSVLLPRKDEIVEMYHDGLTPNEIAKNIGGQRMTVVKFLEEDLNLPVKKHKPRTVQWVGTSHIKCSECSEVNPLDGFYRAGVNMYSRCKTCVSKRQREKRLSTPVSWRHKLNSIRQSAKHRGIKFDIDEKYLSRLWDIQKGRCALTDIELSRLPKGGLTSNSLSVDRIDTTKGYIKGNIVFVTNRANTIKHDLTIDELKNLIPKWYDNLFPVIKEVEKNG